MCAYSLTGFALASAKFSASRVGIGVTCTAQLEEQKGDTMASHGIFLARGIQPGCTAALFSLAAVSLFAQGLTNPPTRKACVGGTTPNAVCQKDADCAGGGTCTALECNETCPPGRCTRDAKGEITSFTKIDPDPTLSSVPAQKDQDKNGDGRVDYFMGEWKFVEGDTDLIIRKWCLNGGPPNGAFHDAYAFELATSTGNQEHQRIPPTNDNLT